MEHNEANSDNLSILNAYYEKLVLFKEKTHDVHISIEKEKDIKAPQYIRLMQPLVPSDHPALLLKERLENSLHLASIDNNRHQLLIELDQISECINRLNVYVSTIAQMGLSSIHEDVRKTRENVLSVLEDLEQRLLRFNRLLKSILETVKPSEPTTSSNAIDYRAPVDEEIALSLPLSLTQQRPPVIEEEQQRPILIPDVSTGSSSALFLPLAQCLGAMIAPFVRICIYIKSCILPTSTPVIVHQASPDIINHPTSDSEVKNDEDRCMYLYGKMKFTDNLELKEICLRLHVAFETLNGNSHHEKAFSLAQQMCNKKCLDELEMEVRRRIPKRFP